VVRASGSHVNFGSREEWPAFWPGEKFALNRECARLLAGKKRGRLGAGARRQKGDATEEIATTPKQAQNRIRSTGWGALRVPAEGSRSSGGAPASCKSPTDDTARGVSRGPGGFVGSARGNGCRVQSCRRCKWKNGQETRCDAPYLYPAAIWTHASGGLPRRCAEPFRQRGPLRCGSVPTACSHWEQ
jgi:hypothetical protein